MAKADRTGATVAPIARTMVDRLTGALAGLRDGWFGPGVPVAPQANETARGRAFDYPVATNISYTPRGEGQNLASFAALRRFADPTEGGADVLRLCIETRKDQMAAQPWTIKARKGRTVSDDAIARALDILARPDGVHGFRAWQRMLLEDHFVLDAPTIYTRPAADRPFFEVLDGATIKPLLDLTGRRPTEGPAFQQILKGVPALDYTADELLYPVFNPRPHRVYGFSRVEQVLATVTLGLNRQLSVLAHYTVGNVPEAMIGVPAEWNPDQIAAFQTYFDALLSGSIESKRKAIFIPGGVTPYFTKDAVLKDQFDEWLARLICYCFSISPQPFVKETNRATADTAKEAALEEGLEPTKRWWKSDVMDVLIAEALGLPDAEFAWQDDEIADALTRAQVHEIYLTNKVLTPDEVRDTIGLEPLTPEQAALLNPPPPPVLAPVAAPGQMPPDAPPDAAAPAPTDPAPPVPPDATKLDKRGSSRGRVLPPVQPTDAEDARTLSALTRAVTRTLTRQRAAVVAALQHQKVAKAEGDPALPDAEALAGAIPKTPAAPIANALKAHASSLARSAVSTVLDVRPINADELDAVFAQASDQAVAWAIGRAADLVTMIDETTRDAIRGAVTDAVATGATVDELAETLRALTAFDDARATLIARTETSYAENAGTVTGYRATGVVAGKQWLIADTEVCDECEALDGEIVALDAAFSSGDDAPPAHPNCRCTTLAVLADEGEADA